MEWPRISLVTPSFNQGKWIERTIHSVLSQGYPNLEYIVMDGGSSDQTVEILNRYQSQLAQVHSGPDGGMYNAIQKGLSLSSGQIMGWLNSDDMLHPRSLFTLARIFTDLPEVDWVTGPRTVWDEQDNCVVVEPAATWSLERILLKDYEWIQQESTFWRRNLWDASGAYISQKHRLAGDFELWSRFFVKARLYSTDALLGGFRVRTANQASLDYLSDYKGEMNDIVNELIGSDKKYNATVRMLKRRKAIIYSLKGIERKRLFNKFYLPHFSSPPRITFDRMLQKFSLES